MHNAPNLCKTLSVSSYLIIEFDKASLRPSTLKDDECVKRPGPPD